MNQYANVWVLGVGRLMVPKLCVLDIPRMNVYVEGTLFPKTIHDFMDKLYSMYGTNYIFYTLYINQSIGNAVFNSVQPLFKNQHVICQYYWIEITKGRVCMKLFFNIYDDELSWIRNLDASNKIDVFTGESTIFLKL